ncbi:hypothetical protein FC19_GL001561 [Liquorilactobacillus aquaticus DSM 21051]|uniref:Uncharacterized protein n=1 Tax=Liquorilactobacillus aquaticus DSM 21051 TaxID=1423725 RepID=A0A0R2D0M2_9LACO|nr:hypothetical protein [Liquorilactobacillus aquaticus]KRM97520.1 hypothetical protein FC19_GL001561 [Liquorilactobacillus aquaticus DSM 21051]
MTDTDKKINNSFSLNKSLVAQKDNTCILFDPAVSTFKKFSVFQDDFVLQVVILTQLSENNLQLLYSAPSKVLFYMSQELFLLLQKMQRFGLVPKITNMGKIIPYDFPQKIGPFKVTAYKNDDSLYGSLALVIRDTQTAIGYVNAFVLYGGHKKRTKKWLKKMAGSNLTAFITSSTMFTDKSAQLPKSENGIQKYFSKQLKSIQPTEPFKVLLSPWNPERLHRFNETCTELNKKLVLPVSIAEFLHFFFPDDTIYCYSTSETVQEQEVQNKMHYISERQLKERPSDFVLQDDANPLFVDPSIQNSQACQKKSWLNKSNFNRTIEPLDEKMLADLENRLNTTNILQC